MLETRSQSQTRRPLRHTLRLGLSVCGAVLALVLICSPAPATAEILGPGSSPSVEHIAHASPQMKGYEYEGPEYRGSRRGYGGGGYYGGGGGGGCCGGGFSTLIWIILITGLLIAFGMYLKKKG